MMKHKYSYSGYIRDTIYYKSYKETHNRYQVEAYSIQQAMFLLRRKIAKDMKLEVFQVDIDIEGIQDYGPTEKTTDNNPKNIVSNSIEEQLSITF